MASYPDSVKSFTTKTAGQTIAAAHVNDLQDEVNAVEAGLLNGTAPLNSSNSTVAALNVTGNCTVVGKLNSSNSTLATLSVTGNSTLNALQSSASTLASLVVSGGSTFAGAIQSSNSTCINLSVTTASTLAALSVSGGSTLAGTLQSSNSTLAALSVSGGSTFAGTIQSSNSTCVNLSVSNNSTIAGELFVTKEPPTLLVAKTAQQEIADNTQAIVTYDSQSFISTSSMHSTTTNPGRLKAGHSSGIYLVGGSVAWNLSTEGMRTIWIYENGAVLVSAVDRASSATAIERQTQTINTVVRAVDTTYYYEIRVRAQAGSTVSLLNSQNTAWLTKIR